MARRPWVLAGGLAVAVAASSPPHVRAASAATASSRVMLGRVNYSGGGDWYANPSSLKNLIRAVAERTSIPIDREEHSVTFRDPRLFDYQFLHLTGHGTITMNPDEVARVRAYLLRGGFLHVDDNYGLDSSFRIVLRQLFPDRPLIDVPLNHPIYRLVYPFPRGVPKIHEHDAKIAQGFGLFVEGKLSVFYSFETNPSDGWADAEVHHDPPEKRELSFKIGTNILVYALSR